MEPSSAIRIQPVDFKRVLKDIRDERKLDLNAVALHANIPRTTLRDYTEGNTQPLHTNGERLIALWCQVTGNHRDQVPRRADIPTARRPQIPPKGALPSPAWR